MNITIAKESYNPDWTPIDTATTIDEATTKLFALARANQGHRYLAQSDDGSFHMTIELAEIVVEVEVEDDAQPDDRHEAGEGR